MLKIAARGMDLSDTFECGQCFRWDSHGDFYEGTAQNGVRARIIQNGDEICIDSPLEDKRFWEEYFNLNNDYEKILKAVAVSDIMRKAAESGKGIRILKQDKWEALCSFIISQNNNIPRIKGIIERLCENFGEGGAFPKPSQIVNQNLSAIRAGFRDKYLLVAASKCVNNVNFLEDIAILPTNELREQLKTIHGVGDKIADCVMLFAYGRYEVFPQDVWIKRVLSEQFGVDERNVQQFADDTFGSYAGFAQQYIYHYFRNLGGIGGAA